jgi:Ca2+-binding RTX toxin-like protein
MSLLDDFASNISTLGSVIVGSSSTGEVTHPGDRDWFSVFLIGGLTYRFSLSGISLGDPTLSLRDPSGLELAFDDDSGVGLNSEIVFTAATSGTYFLDAGSFGSNLGTYVLAATNITVDDFTDAITTTGIISVGGSSTGVVGAPGDRDWFRIDLSAGGTYRFNLDGISLGDPTLSLRDLSGLELAFDDDSGVGLNSEIVFTAATSGTYFLDAGSFGSNLGTYVLSATSLGFVGTDGGDAIVGGIGNDTFFGSRGNDSYDGAGGIDTIDYSSLGQRVTLKSQGVIEKAGGFGTDTIAGLERIIGTLGKSNVIDGTVAGPQSTSFAINLAANNLTVNGIPGIGSASFFVQNFTDVRGTVNADTVIGDGSRNNFFGTVGADSYDGLGGFDTIDYGVLGTAVVLKSQGIIEKGLLGADTIAGMERIIGAAGKINVIDGFTGGPQPTSFEIDLDGGLLVVRNIPVIGDQAFFVKNFVDVRGTTNDDFITGCSFSGIQGDNTFFGTSGNDSYDGAGGIDTIDYSSLGQRVTLKSQGVIEKAGGFGTDTITGVERIIGTLGQSNVIDGTVAGPQATSFVINLATNNLTVNGIPGIGSASFFVQNFTDVRGTSNSDTVVADAAANTFFGSAGNDSHDGAGGIDTIDYSSLGQRVTLKSQGVIEKAGGFGTDTIAGVERIIGTLGQSNVIDGTVAGPQATSFVINLATNNLTVNGIPGIGSASFFVQNFTDVRGTSNSDTVVADAAANTFFGSAGNDSHDGVGGIDTIDYSSLGQRVTLKSQGVIEKAGGFGTDTIAGVERIIGTLGQSNVIDGTVAGPQATSFVINLAINNLTVNGIPGIGSASFFVQNFTLVRGTSNSDTVVGNAAANTFFGNAGNDTLTGGAGKDTYGFDTDLVLGADTLNEAGGGVDTLDFSTTTTRSIVVNLGFATSQVVNANLSLTLGSATTFENVTGGGLADTLTGNNLANTLNGGGGNDTLIGGGGSDTLIGGAGNDSYGFDTDLLLGAAKLNEAGGGVDTLDFSATTTRSTVVNLGLATSQVVNANLSLTLGSATTFENVIGGGLADTLTGNNLANTLNGGVGNDTLIGSAGADHFRFATSLNATTNRDVISDFSIAQGDTIELENAVFTSIATTGTLAVSAFFTGAAATTASQRILYNSATGSLLYDQDGSGAIGSIAFATLASGLLLSNASFAVT